MAASESAADDFGDGEGKPILQGDNENEDKEYTWGRESRRGCGTTSRRISMHQQVDVLMAIEMSTMLLQPSDAI